MFKDWKSRKHLLLSFLNFLYPFLYGGKKIIKTQGFWQIGKNAMVTLEFSVKVILMARIVVTSAKNISFFFIARHISKLGVELILQCIRLSIFGVKRVKFSIKSLFPKFYDHWNASAFFILYFNNLQTLRCNECLSKWFLEFIPLVLNPEYGITNAAAPEWARQVVLLLLTICWCCSNILTSKIKTYI